MKTNHPNRKPGNRIRGAVGLAALGLALAALPAPAATMSASLSPPVIDDEDIASLGDGPGADKWWAENNAGAGSCKGQTFTTGDADLKLKAISYRIVSSQKAEPTKTYVIRIGTISGTDFTEIHSESATQDFTWNNNEYVTWTLDAAIDLEANTTYGIDVGMTASTSAWQTGIPYLQFFSSNTYADGIRYTTGQFGVGTSTISPDNGRDRVFHLDLEVAVVDSDGDLLDDFWEDKYFGDNNGTVEPSDLTVTEGGAADAEGDGATDFQEFEAGSDPHVADTDGDNLNDGPEINTHGTDPTLVDTDGDTLNDDVEVAGPTDPLLADTDGDNLRDDEELVAGADGFITDPTDADSDDDNVNDDLDGSLGLNPDPNDPTNDCDGDTLQNQVETNTGIFVSASDTGTDPLVADTDDDGLDDDIEVAGPTDPFDDDSDDDGVLDGDDTAPNDPGNDSDGDTIANNTEVTNGTDPNKADTDDDGLDDNVETDTGTFVSASDTGSDPLSADTDGDGLEDGVETGTETFTDANDTGTDPNVADSDGDGFDDGLEVAQASDPNDAGSFPILPAGIAVYRVNNDADSGIDAANTYTHAIDFGSGTVATVNGVTFAGSGPGAFPGAVGSSTIGTGSSTIPNNHGGDGTHNVSGDVVELFRDMIYNDPTTDIQLTGLTPGLTYDFRYYMRSWGNGGGNRVQDFLFDGDGDNTFEATVNINQDNASLFPPGFAIADQSYALSYVYTAGASGTLNLKVNQTSGGTFHLYGLTNQVASAPLPPNLVLDALPGDMLRLSWDNMADKLYNVRAGTDLSDVSGWGIFDGNEDLAADASGTNTVEFARPMDATLLFLVEEFDVPPPPLQNGGFENPVTPNEGGFTADAPPHWTELDDGSLGDVGIWNPTTADYPAIPGGTNVGYIYHTGIPMAAFGLSQVLGESFAENTAYTVTVEVGLSNTYAWPGYRIELWAGATKIAEDNNTLAPAAGTFETSTVTYTYSAADVGLVGETLEIRLLSLGEDPNGAGAAADFEVEFDDVTFTVVP